MQEFTGTEYVMIDIANQFGLDRLRWTDRIHWVRDNHPDLDNLTDQAKHPIPFGKALRALANAKAGKPSNHIMGLDATASGIQLMAAMSGCISSARTVNLLDTGNREDIYSRVAAKMSQFLKKEITRDIVKKPVMTFFYGSRAVPKAAFGDNKGYAAFISTLADLLKGPYQLMELFQSFWNPTAIKYTWAMPDGHVVHIPITTKEDKGLEIDEAEHLRFTYRAEVIKPQPEGRALAANIVHSVDAWVCREMTKKAKALGFYLAPIHDCFYAHPNNMNDVRQIYRELLAEVARQNLVTAILSQIGNRRIAYNKLAPALDEHILQSEYALS